jgi:two-component system sensor histidine kinase MprB
MSMRKRLALVAAASVGVAIVLASVVCYAVVRAQLRGQIDNRLRAQGALVQSGGTLGVFALQGGGLPTLPANAGGPAPYAQVVLPDGEIRPVQGNLVMPVSSQTLAVANGNAPAYFADVYVAGSHLRVYTFPVTIALVGGGEETAAVQLAQPLYDVDHVLSNLRLVLIFLSLGGIGLAAVMGRLAARPLLAPLAEVAETAQQIGETDDLSRRLSIHADDEVGQLARRFNVMLERLQASRQALDESVHAQRQLVADASHELRTPVTSLRTNVEVLLAGAQLDDEDRSRLLSDVAEQSEELSTLVADLIELARGDRPIGEPEDVRLDRLVGESVAWARRNPGEVRFDTALTPVIVDGVPERLERAVNNLLDNAARHSPPGGVVEVMVDEYGVRVRDHGTGVDEADLPYVFDRFFRGSNSRGRQGSGLGLAIVKQVAEQHGGSVAVTNAADGGAVFTLHLPTTPADPDETVTARPPAPAEVG